MVKVLCPTCNTQGQLQQIGNSGNYYRIAHYKMVDGKAKYHYHQVSKEYAEVQLSLKGVTISKRSKVKPKVQSMNKGDLVNKSIDQNKTESSLKEVIGAAERMRLHKREKLLLAKGISCRELLFNRLFKLL